MVIMKIYLRPYISDSFGTNRIVEIIPKKKYKAKKPNLLLSLQRVSYLHTQLSIYSGSSLSALYWSLDRFLWQMSPFEQGIH
jgi:hypothetical protein